jgi:hypothetical protein
MAVEAERNAAAAGDADVQKAWLQIAASYRRLAGMHDKSPAEKGGRVIYRN